ncbi:MAG TPA: hypothetical protein VMR41_04870 [Patescibacteria group bacterium]|nr:hypothetical protein [Patescibacteria group bacterium]
MIFFNLNKKFKKAFTVFLIIFFLVAGSIERTPLVYAQTVPTDTPAVAQDTSTPSPADTSTPTSAPSDTTTPAPTSSPTDSPTLTPSPTSTLTPTDTGTPTPTTDPNLSDTPTPTVDTSVNDNADAASPSADTPTPSDNSNNQTANNSSDNTSGSGSSNSSASPSSSSVTTGDATSSVDASNTVNTTSINSQIIQQTLNIFVDQNGDLNLSSPSTIASDVVSQHPNDPQINVELTGVNNYTYLSNTIVSTANSGNNNITDSSGNAIITTGEACSLASLLNQVNFTIINSTIHILTINIFGNVNGNIILPENNLSTQSSASVDANIPSTIDNTALVTNTVNSSATTGGNTLTTTSASTSGGITTGSASSAVDLLNVVNTSVYGINFGGLYINLFGTWNGNFLGWNDLSPQIGGTSLSLDTSNPDSGTASDPSNSNNNSAVSNVAIVNNNITSIANTGGNTVNASSGSINTGNAISEVSLFNFVNSSFINSFGYFGFINIFGTLNGDIGGTSEFITPTSTSADSNSQDDTSSDSTSNQKEDGGALSLSEANNVGAYVLPGDTVTVFLTGKNIGTGKVYGATLTLHLMKDGKDLGDPTFAIGDLSAGVAFKLSTGLVLAQNTVPGEYSLHAVLSGTTGENDTSVSASADNSFTVKGNGTLFTSTKNIPVKPSENSHHKSVLGLTNISNITNNNLLALLSLLLLIYFIILITKNKRYFVSIGHANNSIYRLKGFFNEQ